ncbi:hypothetical protein HMPREF1549_03301, partial [Actinomyces johnsonii F0510]
KPTSKPRPHQSVTSQGNLTSYTIRSLIHAGRLKDHLTATTYPLR